MGSTSDAETPDRSAVTAAVAVLLLAAASGAQSAAPITDKSGFHLFNPTPREQMREMNTDRPDLTESPYTVDAGHVQIEMDLVRFTYDRHNPERTDRRVKSWSIADTNVKVGLLNDLDLQVVTPLYNLVDVDDRTVGRTSHQRGFGDLTVRLKYNFWGNDGGETAFGVMPFVKIPTNEDHLGNHAVEGGLILPLAVALPGGWDMGLMAEFDFDEDADADGYHEEFVNSITFGHDIVGNLSGFVEFASIATTDSDGHWIGLVDLGPTYAVTDDFHLDTGVNIGVSRAADDVSVFAGLSWRF